LIIKFFMKETKKYPTGTVPTWNFQWFYIQISNTDRFSQKGKRREKWCTFREIFLCINFRFRLKCYDFIKFSQQISSTILFRTNYQIFAILLFRWTNSFRFSSRSWKVGKLRENVHENTKTKNFASTLTTCSKANF
jgi:hypothetical protein